MRGECDIGTIGARKNYFALTKIFCGGLNPMAGRAAWP
jgi:hypothetical protein